MTALIPLVLYAYLPAMLIAFAVLPARRAALLAYLLAWLFLPLKAFHLPGLPEYSKVSAAAYACLLGSLIFHSGQLLRIRPGWLDIPVVAYVLAPILTNTIGGGAGLYEGIATSNTEFMLWGIPWIMGRAYFSDLDGARELALGLVLGVLIYVPLCLIEIRMSPQLNLWVYGFHQHAMNQTRRFGGWRPMVFMQHGLALGLWMCAGAVMAVWLLRAKVLPRMASLPPVIVAAAIVITAILCKSTGAILISFLALGLLFVAWRFNRRLPIYALILIAPLYMTVRSSTEVVLTPAVQAVKSVFGRERAESLETRLRNEQLIVNRTLERPFLGWGGGGRYLVRDPTDINGRILSVPDQFWVIVIGRGGLLSLLSVTASLLLPALLFFRTCPPRDLLHVNVAPLAALSIIVVMFMLDCLMNAMLNPLYVMASASVAGVTMAARRSSSHPIAAPASLPSRQGHLSLAWA
jgi:hypothetical protein